MSTIYLPKDASKSQIRAAENARKNRLEIVKAYSHGQVSRRDIFKWGLVTGAGLIAPLGGLSPFVGSARADSIPTGAPPSQLSGAQPFSQPMLRLEVLNPRPAVCIDDPGGDPKKMVVSAGQSGLRGNDAEWRSCQEQIDVHPALGGGKGPCEGRPFDPRPGKEDYFAHQFWHDYEPKVAYDVSQMPAVAGQVKFHPSMPAQDANSVWTFNGTIPPKLVLGRYGEPILFRHHNNLPADVKQNNGFGRHTISTHEHNGHHGYENDGFTGAFFYPGQYYDYHWPIKLAGFSTINQEASDPRAGAPADNGGINKVAGDWRETMSTHWFHDHMFGFTAQNVYKGNAAMFNIYSSLDRGAEDINDGTNFRLPSGRADKTGKSWGNLDYDVNLMVADKAFDSSGQLYFDIFNLDGFIGDVMTVNACYKPFFQVEPRKYRFRILNASVSRFFKIGLADEKGNPVQFTQIGNDGNLLPNSVPLTEMDEQGIAERYDIVIDFSKFNGKKLYLVNLCEHQDGAKPSKDLRLADAWANKSNDPCIGKFLEFQVTKALSYPDESQVPAQLIPNPVMPAPVRTRTFEFGKGGGQDGLPWTIKVDGGQSFNADYAKASVMPQIGTSEIWVLKNGGGGWDHPIHIHFEEGQILSRNGAKPSPAEAGRKDVYRLKPSGEVRIQMQFREFAGMYMEHCHNTQHEDNAMLLRWDVNGGGLVPMDAPNPSPQGQYGTVPTTVASKS
jgi:manganese oxidase